MHRLAMPIRRFLWCLILLSGCFKTFAQNTVLFKRITVDNGLAHNTVMSILQDKKGMIWVGTYDGLSKFNGIEFSVYKNNFANGKSLSNNQVNELFEDHNGNIWVNTVDGTNQYNRMTDSFVSYTTGDSSYRSAVLAMVEDKTGVIWGGSGTGLINYDPRDPRCRAHHFLNPNICNIKIQCLYIDNQQRLWIGTQRTLQMYDLVKKRLIAVPPALQKQTLLMNSVIRSVIQDHDGNYWIGTETEGLFYYNVKTATCVNYHKGNGLLSNTVRALLEAENGKLWVGTKNGLNIINTITGKISAYTYDPYNANSLSQNSIRTILKDKEGNIWLGTYNGGLNVVYAQSANFYHLGIKQGNNNGLSYGIVNTMMQDNDGSFWVGTDDGGLNHVSATLENTDVYYQQQKKNKEQLGNSIKAIAWQDDKNKLWVGTGTGLKIFDKITKTFADAGIIAPPQATVPIQNYVLLKDGTNLWAGTNFGGLYLIQNKKVIRHYLPQNDKNSISSNIVTALLRDGDNLWIGTKSSGLNCLNIFTQKITQYKADAGKPYSLTNNSVLCIFKDSNKRLWVGTDGGGLNYLDVKTKRFYPITEGTGLANNTIHQLLQDQQGRIWMSTNHGLSGIGFKQFNLPFHNSDLVIVHYSVEDGLQSNQFTNSLAVKTQNQQLIFGGINGITAFYPDKITINETRPPVVFTDFFVLNKPVRFGLQSLLTKPIDETNTITLPYNQAFFSIRFAALNYINPSKNQFAYKLEGFSDDEWHYVGNQQTATYTNLDPGSYFFKLKAANNDGIWNNTPRILKIIVLPPWYKTWYAYIGYLFIIIVLLYLFNIYSKKTALLQAKLEFELISHLKDQELAQKKLSFFTNISHEIKTPLTMILAPIERLLKASPGNQKVENQLLLMQRNGDRLLRLINQLLDIRKFESGHMHLQATEGDIVVFLKEIVLAFNGLAQSKNIKLSIKSEDAQLLVWFDCDKLEKIVYNLLSNSLKFTPPNGTITLYVEREQMGNGDNNVMIRVVDNGCGISEQNMTKLFNQFSTNEHHFANTQGTGLGLAFSKELVELHHGHIKAESKPESGAERGFTCLKVSLLLGNDHLKEHEMVNTFNADDNMSNYTQTETGTRHKFSLRKSQIIKAEEKDKLYLLIIEDNEDVLNFIKTGFEDDFVIYTATNGLDGWDLAKAHIPDIIISDVMMPKMDGIELCRHLKTDMETSHIPIILLTARTPLIFKVEGLDTGADDYVTKPFAFSILEARVWNLVENRQKMRLKYQKEIMLEPGHVMISDADELFLEKIMAYIENHIDDVNLSVENLNQEVAMSRSTFTKKLKALTNQTGVEFIRTVRLKRAAQLLSHGQFNVNEIVYKVGFEDINYFGKCFKEQFGYTPKEQTTLKQKRT